MINLAPKLERSWLEVELKPLKKNEITSKTIEKFQKELAQICGMHVFCGPIIIAPDSKNKMLPYYTNKKFRPRDWNAYTWWGEVDVTKIVTILDHSHTAFYYYPLHNLVDVSIATCKNYDLSKVLKYTCEFWHPDKSGIRYAFLSPNLSGCSWKIYPQNIIL